MVQDKKKFTSGSKNETSKNLDNRKGQAQANEKDNTRTGTMKDHNSKDKDMNTKRDVNTRK